MRESVGGAWLFGIVIVFIFIFAAFMAYSVSYSKAFALKNEIISIIEENEGFSKFLGDADNISTCNEEGSTECKIFQYMQTIGYNFSANIECDSAHGEETFNGYCLRCISESESGHFSSYKVKTFMAMDIPFLGITVKIPVSGETRTIYTNSCEVK